MDEVPHYVIQGLHSGQREIVDQMQRFTTVMCGRRFGKSTMGEHIASVGMVHNMKVGWFGPTYKSLDPQFENLTANIGRKPFAITNQADKDIQRIDGGNGRIDFWSCDKPDPGRGRSYDIVIIDEAGLIKKLREIWFASIRPTLSDRKGNAFLLGTPKGSLGFFNELFKRGMARKKNHVAFRRGSIHNPFIDPIEIEDARAEMPPEIFAQEYEGIPADDGGNPFGLKAIEACFDPHMIVEERRPIVFGVDVASKLDYTWIIGLNKWGEVVVSDRFQAEWPYTKKRIAEIVAGTPCLVDETGVGDPVVSDLQEDYGCHFEGFRFTNSSKQMLMVGLRNDLQTKTLTFNDERLKDELDVFGYEFKEGKIFYSAPEGLHDDGVCGLALACEMRRRGPQRRVLEPGAAMVARSATEF